MKFTAKISGLFPANSPSVHLQATSHLVDICRQTIIFEDMSSLAECLRVIRLDQEVRVVRIKNRLDPAYNARLSAGYRDLAINMTLASDEVMAMGLEAHVCEVQLILLPMYQLKVSTWMPHQLPVVIILKYPVSCMSASFCSFHCIFLRSFFLASWYSLTFPRLTLNLKYLCRVETRITNFAK
jgi:hypothetical protein